MTCPLGCAPLVRDEAAYRDNRMGLPHTVHIGWCPVCGLGVTIDPPDDLDSHVVAAALIGVLRSVQRVAVAEMQLDLPALMDHAFDLLESGLAGFAARPRPRPGQ